MEWYLGSEVDDFVVPKDQESLERIYSPDSWSQWGTPAFGPGSDFPQKNLFAATNPTCSHGFNFDGKRFPSAINVNSSAYEREHQANNSRVMCQGLYNGSLQWPHDEDQANIDRMDDIFFNSLLEEDVTSADDPNGSTQHAPESNYDVIPADNMFKGAILEPQYIPSNSRSMGSSKYLKTHAFSPSVDWENGEVSSTCPLEEMDGLNSYAGEESSLEETVLQELEMVTAQFTEKMRICFRDALYRLAENSKQTISFSHDEDIIMENHPMLTSDDEASRVGEMEVTELKTNAIDRAVASLMFSRMNFVDDNNETEQPGCGLSQQKISYCPRLARLAGDAEVPTVGQGQISQ